MSGRKRAFSLLELLVALAVVIVLSAILFPVFQSARMKAKQTVWVDSVRQVSLASSLYLGDYDDYFMVARYAPGENGRPENDRTWVQSLLPYVKSFSLFVCPVDDTRPASMGLFDADIVPGDAYARYYTASQRVNLGYNYLYLSPLVYQGGWQSYPRSFSDVAEPSRTVMLGESAWQIENGRAMGGGHYLVIPPCRYSVGHRIEDSFGVGIDDPAQLFLPGLQWTEETNSHEYTEAGGLYPWFGDEITILMVGGNVKRMTRAEVTDGCDVKPQWQGLITNPNSYIWDLR